MRKLCFVTSLIRNYENAGKRHKSRPSLKPPGNELQAKQEPFPEECCLLASFHYGRDL